MLENILSEGIDIHRCLAAKALGEIGDKSSTPTLIAGLLDEDEDVRSDAAEALRHFADPISADQLLENLLGDPCTEVKLAAIDILAALGDARVVPWLRKLVLSRDEEIIWDQQEFYSSGWDDWVDIQSHAVAALGVLNVREAVPDIVIALADENAQDLIDVAFAALSKLGRPGIDALAGFLEANSNQTRRRAAAVLAAMDEAYAKEAAAIAFVDTVSDVRLAATRARAGVSPDDTMLAGCLTDPTPSVRVEIINLVGHRYPDALVPMLDDPSDDVQAAVLAVFASGAEPVVDNRLKDLLAAKIKSGNSKVSGAAAKAFARIAPSDAEPVLLDIILHPNPQKNRRLGALKAFLILDSEQICTALIGMIDDDERQIRLKAISALARIARKTDQWPNDAAEALLRTLRGAYEPEEIHAEIEETPEVNANIGEDVTSQDDEAETELAAKEYPSSTLASILSDAPELAEVAGLPEPGETLDDEDMERLAIARSVLSKKKVSPNPKVIVHDDIRRFAARVVGDLTKDEVTAELGSALTSEDQELALAAADSLSRIGSRTGRLPFAISEIVKDRMQSSDRDLKIHLIRCLSTCGEDETTSYLEGLLADDDSFIRSEAVKALSVRNEFGSNAQEMLADPDPAVRLSSAQAIAKSAASGVEKKLVDFAISFEGYHGRQTARLLKDLDVDAATDAFLDILDDPNQKRIWAIAIESLGIIHLANPPTGGLV